MKLIDADFLLEQVSDWYFDHDAAALAKDPCVVDAMIDMFVRKIYAAPNIQINNMNRDLGEWVVNSTVITPGGDPYYECSNCHHGGHINGIEHQEHWEYCPDCGSHNRMEH